MISENPDSLIFLIYRKPPDSLTWDIWFSLIHKNTFDAQTSCPLMQTSIQPDSSPHSSEQFSQGYLRCCLLGLSPKNFRWIKGNSRLLGCIYFFSQQTQNRNNIVTNSIKTLKMVHITKEKKILFKKCFKKDKNKKALSLVQRPCGAGAKIAHSPVAGTSAHGLWMKI